MKNSLTAHETECDKCDGTGRKYQQSVGELLKRWRESLGISQTTLGGACRVSKAEISKFENGRIALGQTRIRKIIRVLENWE
ncbi:MAG: helix-turn-helix domain-containing protein [Acidobacteriota bacterium]|nr:helix-turn-helix domain-containing protein [Acidobacteriota bacterium]